MGPDPGPPPDVVWENMNNGYSVTQFYHGDCAKDTDMFVGGAQDNGTSRVLSAVTPEDWRMIYGFLLNQALPGVLGQKLPVTKEVPKRPGCSGAELLMNF